MHLKAMRADSINPTVITQFRLYMHQYQRGTFAVHAPNDVVRTVTGREPESFDTIAKRVVGDNTEAVRSTRNRIEAVASILRILLTPTPSVPAERPGDHAVIADGVCAAAYEEWARLHNPATGVVLEAPARL